MLYPVKIMGTTTVTNHQSNVSSSKSNGNVNNNLPPPQQPEKLIGRRIPRLVRSPAAVDDHNNNLLTNDCTSYKNGLNGQNGIVSNNHNGTNNGKVESNLKLLSRPTDIGELNGNATKLVRIKNAGILKSPNFRMRVTSRDE